MWISLVVAIILVAVGVFFNAYFRNSIIISNVAQHSLEDVSLVVRSTGGEEIVRKHYDILEPSNSVATGFFGRDIEVQLCYSYNNQPQRCFDEFVDLWTGETWIVEVKSDGQVQTGYRYTSTDP